MSDPKTNTSSDGNSARVEDADSASCDPLENNKMVDDPNDLQMIDLCKDIMIHERDKNSAYTRVLTEQIVFLKSELHRKQTTIETLLKLLMQKDQSAIDEGDITVAKIQEMIRNGQVDQNKDVNSSYRNIKSDKDPGTTRLEFIESIGSSVLKQRRDVEVGGKKKKEGIERFERYGYKLINTDIGEF